MKLLALVKNVEHVCCRYRLAALQPHLARAGHDLRLCPWPKSWLGRFWLRPQLCQADVVIVQRRRLGPLELRYVRAASKRLIYDFDDAVFMHHSYARPGFASMNRLNSFLRTIRAADLVFAGNEFLAHRAAAVIGAGRVHVIPTCVDLDRYVLAEHSRAGAGVRLTWIGSSSTLKGLERTTALWEEIGRSCPGLALKVICDRGLSLEHLPVEFRAWSKGTEAADLAQADIGISWLPDDPWSRGKCGLKVLQYMAAGLPVLANPVGVQAEMVRHGETGFLLKTSQQWCEAVKLLASDPGLRLRMGQAGRRLVETRFSVASGGARWLEALEKTAVAPVRQEVAA